MSAPSGPRGPDRPDASPDPAPGRVLRVLQVVALVLLLVLGGVVGVRVVSDGTGTAPSAPSAPSAQSDPATGAGTAPASRTPVEDGDGDGDPSGGVVGEVVGDDPGEALSAARPGDVLRAGPAIERARERDPPGDALSELARTVEDAAVGAAPGRRPRAQQRGCVPTQPTTVRVATYNILGAGSRSGGGYDLARVRADLASWDVDVAILQEVYRLGGDAARSDQPADLAAGLDMDWAFGYNARKGVRTQYGTAVLSRYPIVEQANARLPNWSGLEQRGLLRATVDVEGTRLDVYDTHLQHTPQAAPLRTQQARSIAGMIGARRSATGNPAVLGGDFNSSPTGTVGAALNGVLRDTWFDVGVGQGATHPAGRVQARIDRLYQSGDVVPLAAAVRPSATSDHEAVTAVYELPGRVCR